MIALAVAGLLALSGVRQEPDPELERALKAERERIAARKPLTVEEAKQYAAVASLARPAAKPRASYALAVVPLEFSDAKRGSRDLGKDLARVAEFYRVTSGGAFTLTWKLRPAVTVDAARADLAKAPVGGRGEKAALAGVAAVEGADGELFVAAGGAGERGTALWPHKESLEAVDYLLVPEAEDEARWVAIVAHEFGHLLGLEDKYEDKSAKVGRWCLMGTGYLGDRAHNPLPLCGVCRQRLGWAAAPDVRPDARLSLAPGEIARIPVAGEKEGLVLEMREKGPLVVWHTGGGKPIELAALLPTATSDRLTPYSDPPFLGRTLGSQAVWLTDVRVESGRAWVRVAASGELTPLEELRRSRVGTPLGK